MNSKVEIPSKSADFINIPFNLAIGFDGVLRLKSLDKETETFPELQAMRSNARDRYTSRVGGLGNPILQMACSTNGLRLANIGLSAAINTAIAGNTYAVLVSQNRPDFEDEVLKPVTGYVNFKDGENTLDAKTAFDRTLREELGEEIYAQTSEGLLLRSSLSGEFSQEAFKLPYMDNGHLEFEFSQWPEYIPHKRKIVMNDEMHENRGFYIDEQNQSGQLILPLEMRIQDLSGLTLSHTEDGNVYEDQSTGEFRLPVHHHPNGLKLIKLNSNGDLSSEVYQLTNGELIESGNLNQYSLSEAFVQPERYGLVDRTSISGEEYLTQQK